MVVTVAMPAETISLDPYIDSWKATVCVWLRVPSPRSVMNAQSRFPTSAHSNRIEFSRIAPHGGCWNKHKHRLSNLHALAVWAFIARAAWPTTETSVECNATAPRWRTAPGRRSVCGVCVIGFAWTWTLIGLTKHGFTLISTAKCLWIT